MRAVERVEGPTPNGAWAIVVWMDIDRWVEVPREQANGAVITEYDEYGKQTIETVARLEAVVDSLTHRPSLTMG